MVLPLNFIKFHHFVPSHSFFFIQDFDGMLNVRKIRLERESFNFHHFLGKPSDTFLTGKHGIHYGLLTKYPTVGDGKQQNHTAPKFYMVQHNEELTFYGLQIDAHLSSEIPLDTHGHQLQTAKVFSPCPYKLSNDSK